MSCLEAVHLRIEHSARLKRRHQYLYLGVPICVVQILIRTSIEITECKVSLLGQISTVEGYTHDGRRRSAPPILLMLALAGQGAPPTNNSLPSKQCYSMIGEESEQSTLQTCKRNKA